VAKSKQFHWVIVNRDYTPAITKRFNVSAHPSLAVLGPREENIHRWSGFKEPERMLPFLNEGLARWKLFQAGKDWSVPTPRPEALINDDDAEAGGLTCEALGPFWDKPKIPMSACFHKGELWVNMLGQLYTLDPKTGTKIKKWVLPPSTQGICSDGTNLWALASGWTKGDPIRVCEDVDGRVIREITTEANKSNHHSGANGILWVGDKLYVFEGSRGTLSRVNTDTGVVEWSGNIGATWCSGIAWDGTHFVTTSLTRKTRELLWLDVPEKATKGTIVKRVKLNYQLRALTMQTSAADHTVYGMEQPDRDYDANHKRVYVWPRQTMLYKVTVKRP
jgi:hypothetical protein